MARDPTTLQWEPLTLLNVGGEQLIANFNGPLKEIAELFSSGELKSGATATVTLKVKFKLNADLGTVEIHAGVSKSLPTHPPTMNFALLRGSQLMIEPPQGTQLTLDGESPVQFPSRRIVATQEK